MIKIRTQGKFEVSVPIRWYNANFGFLSDTE
jgi:hypothetical protein